MKKGKIKSVIGTLAVLFSIQPLAVWAAGGTTNAKLPTKQDSEVRSGGDKSSRRGPPICGG